MCYLLLSIQQIAGESRGFAFLTFSTIEEARKWLEIKQVDKRSHPLLVDEDDTWTTSVIKKKSGEADKHVEVSQIDSFLREKFFIYFIESGLKVKLWGKIFSI